jgi:amino acid adenylation domain-containing protein
MAVTTISFDISVLEIYFPLASGARVALGGRELALDGARLGQALEETGATHLQATPSGWRLLLDSGWSGKPGLRMLSGGEALPRDLADRLLAISGEDGELWNQYGPTEATVWSTAARVEPGDAPIALGRPLANSRVYLLDLFLGPVPQGTPGELYIGGRGLARGYLGRPDLTADRFIPDPVSGEPGGRLYRTGDLARHLQDGRLAFLGRADHQIKLRGHRIELGEIEAALRSHPAVADGAVLMHGEGSRDGFLTGYLVLRKTGGVAPSPEILDPEELRAYLRRRLPESMVPAAFVTLDALPLSRTGKVDRRRLEQMAPGGVLRPRRSHVAPRNRNEEILFGIWSEILGPERIGDGFGVFDDFFALGGHSLIATQLLARIHDAFGVELPVRTVFQASTVAAQAGVVTAAQAGGPARETDGPIRRLPREAGLPLVAPLSFAQERLWFLDQLTPGLAVYNMPLALRVTGDLDLEALDRTFTAVVARHEALRTTFPAMAGQAFQQVLPAAPWTVPVTDLAGEADPEDAVDRLAREEALAPFDLAEGPLLRTRLLRLGPQEHVLLLTVHHIVSDLWSNSVLVQDVAALYPAFAAGTVPSLPDLPVQYADFAVWQRGWLQGDELERQLAYWRRRLAGAPAALELPTDRPRPATQTYRGGGFLFDLPAELSAGLAALAERQAATPFMLLSAALGTLLGRLAGQDDVVLGFPVADRRRPELEGLIGMFVNTLPLRVELRGGAADGPSFADLVARVREAALETFEHQDVPFERIVEDLQPKRDLSRHPIFQATLSVQNVPLSRIDLEGLTLEPVGGDFSLTKFDLGFMIYDMEGRLGGRLEYASDLFDAATVERWLGHLRTLLGGIVARPDRPLAELPVLSDEERRQVVVAWNQTAAGYPQSTVHALFAEQAERTPEAVAVICGAERLTYRELRDRAGRLARRLRAVGVGQDGAETRVGLLAGRTTGLLVGLLGILEAGGAYLPLDPAYPPERLQFVLGDAAVEVLVAEPALLEGPLAGAEAGRRLVELGSEADGPDGEKGEPFQPAADPDRLAYVMYTSGSTGEPKGVAVTHRNVVRLVRSAAGEGAYADFGPDRTFLRLAPTAFDASTLEIWGPLLNGGRLVLYPGDRASLDDLAEVIRRDGVDSLWLTAGLFHQIVDLRPEALRPLKQLLAGGDVISAGHVRRLLEALPGLAFVNGYGPTEGTTFTCCHRVTAPEQAGDPLPIGRPIGNARVYALDRGLRPVPVGVGGELYLGGDGLARGYLDRPGLTAERFVPDPFRKDGDRLYRTGDLVRWRPDGTLEFLGRNDGQVKVRGFRVEPAEVETVLARHPAVRRAAVGVVTDPSGDRALAAYVVPRETPVPDLPDQLRAYLKAWLPEPMVPAVWRILEELPLTANGKVDHRALAELGAGAVPQAAGRPPYEPPTTLLETDLLETCAEVLGLDRVGLRDNFFDLGGHSLLGTQLIARMLDRTGIEIPLYALFEATDFADLADRIMEEQLSQADEVDLGEVLEELEGQAG